MKALDRKLWRDLWHMKGQALAIALVIVSGVATFVMFISTMDTLNITRDAFYRDYGFADVFASLKRAPENVKKRIMEIPGVDKVETRVVADVKLDITGYPEPVTAKLVSLPDTAKPLLNRLFLRRGRLVAPWSDKEVVVSETFAEAHHFSPGDTFGAVINGRWKKLVIVGIALSPEFVLQVRPGAISPDYKRYGIIWMGRKALGTAYAMDGAFNDVVLTLARSADIGNVLVRLDDILARYGGLGSYGRKDQVSHRFLTEEFRQLQRSAEIFPTIFISVAAFLLNVVISRTVSTQREQVAALKAFGYSNMQVGMHYFKLVALIVMIGVAGGQTVVILEPTRSNVLDPRSRAEAEATASAAQAALHSAKENSRAAAADAEYARQRLERNKKLFSHGYIARDDLDQAESDAKRNEANLLSAKAAVRTARAELDRARAALRYSAAEGHFDHARIFEIRTPVSGRVLRKQSESEGAVNAGDPLIDIGDPAKLDVKVEVLSDEAVNIKPGTPVLFERWGGDVPLTGKVRTIEPQAFTKISSLGVEEQRVFVIADITSIPESWQRLGDGYRVDASFIVWEGKDVLQVPASALFRKGEDWAVFTMSIERAHQRTVRVGHRNGLSAEIISGVSEGEKVIIHPDDAVKDGVRVKMR